MSPLTPRKFAIVLLALAGVAAGAAVVGVAVGAEWVSPLAAISGDEDAAFILLRLRLPRVLVGLFVGGALAACGAAFQALLRNPLASPFVLGISGGGSLGAVLAIVMGVDAFAVAGVSVSTRPAFAFLG